jgi:hypothetical protein
MASVSHCLRDGYSSRGTAGCGLGAIARLSQLFEVYSIPGGGTVLLSQLLAKTVPDTTARAKKMECGVINRPKPGQDVCGDSWAVDHLPGRSMFFLADGLGHGLEAATASQDGVRAFHKHKTGRPKEIIEAVHAALHGTRGAAAAVVEIDFSTQEVCFAGIGNIAGTVFSAESSHSMVSHNGIVGHQIRKIQEFIYPWTAESLLILHSDGLSSRWQLEHYSGLTVRHPGLIAGVLYRDFQRDNDDATVLVGSLLRKR